MRKCLWGSKVFTLFGSGYNQAEMSNKRQSERQTEEVLDDSGVGLGVSKWRVGIRTYRISRLVVPFRSGNSWRSVAPFRDLVTKVMDGL